MFVKVTKSGPRQYVQLVEASRDDNGRPKQRTVATLGRLDKLGDELEAVVEGLCRVTGRTLPDKPDISFESSRALGDVWPLTQLWSALGFDQLRKIFRDTRHSIPVEALIRIMVMNRLTSSESKLGVLRWLETVWLPGLGGIGKVDHQHLLRAMDAFCDHQAAINDALTGLLRPLVDQELYDMTTLRTEGVTEQIDELRQHGRSKDGGIRRQVMLGMVQTAEGLPLYHQVFEGNTAEVKTLQPTLEAIVQCFAVKRVVVVADRGLLSLDNLAELQQIQSLEQEADALARKLDAPDQGQKARGRKLSDGGATAKLYQAVSEQRLGRIIRVDLKSPLFSYNIDEQALHRARLMDGKLLLVTNVQDLPAEEIVQRYKLLADIERGFRVLKSAIEIGPIYHRLPDRIRAHAMICFIALVLHRVMRMRLKAVGSAYSPTRALEQRLRIQYHQANLNAASFTGISTISAEQLSIFTALEVSKSTASRDLALL